MINRSAHYSKIQEIQSRLEVKQIREGKGIYRFSIPVDVPDLPKGCSYCAGTHFSLIGRWDYDQITFEQEFDEDTCLVEIWNGYIIDVTGKCQSETYFVSVREMYDWWDPTILDRFETHYIDEAAHKVIEFANKYVHEPQVSLEKIRKNAKGYDNWEENFKADLEKLKKLKVEYDNR